MYIYSNSYCRNTVFRTVDDKTVRCTVHLQIKCCIYGYTQLLCNFYSSFAVDLGYMNSTESKNVFDFSILDSYII